VGKFNLTGLAKCLDQNLAIDILELLRIVLLERINGDFIFAQNTRVYAVFGR